MASKLNILLLVFCVVSCAFAIDVEKDDTTTNTTSTTPSTTSSSSSSSSSSSTSTTTTEAPTTISPVTTTAAPPLPEPEVGEWNSTCIKLKFAAQLSFAYTTVDNKTKQTKYNLPAKQISKFDDDCEKFNGTQNIELRWADEKTKIQNSVHFQFYQTENSFSLGLIKINLEPKTIFADANNDSIQLIYRHNSTFVTPLHMSYHCTRGQTFNLTELFDSKPVIGNITLSNVQIEAFHKKDEKSPAEWGFSAAKDCDANNTPDIVPIAVGIALSALILIVFISYLVARRRSTNRGYMSF